MKSQSTVLVVEDEPAIADTIIYALRTEGLDTHWVKKGEEALAAFKALSPALILLDVGLPDINGFDVCREIRKTSDIPIVFLTSRTDEVDVVVGLEIGGDDYILKPFSPRILTARVRARLRKQASDANPKAPEGQLFTINENAYDIQLAGKSLDLSRYEFRILKLLMENPKRVYSRNQLMDLLWEEPDKSYDRTIDTHIKTIRKKIRTLEPQLDPIRTHRGIGYSFEA